MKRLFAEAPPLSRHLARKDTLKVAKGGELFGIETEDGYRIARHNLEFERQMEPAREIIKKRRNVLRQLAR